MTQSSVDGIDFHQLARREKNAQQRIRLLALAHVKDGKTRTEVSESLKISRSSVNNWVKRYKNEGIDGIIDKKRSGRPTVLALEQQQQLINYIHHAKMQGKQLKGRHIHQYLQHTFNIHFELSHVYRLLKKINISLKS